MLTSYLCFIMTYLILIDRDHGSFQLNVSVLVAAQELPWRLLQPAGLPSGRHLSGLGWLLFYTLFWKGRRKSALVNQNSWVQREHSFKGRMNVAARLSFSLAGIWVSCDLQHLFSFNRKNRWHLISTSTLFPFSQPSRDLWGSYLNVLFSMAFAKERIAIIISHHLKLEI